MKNRGIFVKIILAAVIFTLSMPGVALAEGKSTKIGQEDLIYFLMTDRFYNGDNSNDQDIKPDSLSGYHGGDFQGIIDKLDYIKDLGFTSIWISPVVENQVAGYHGYWATDFYKTNEHFGSLEKLKELVQKAHEKGIKVIVDIVVNHTGLMHPWNDDPKYESWFNDWGNISDYSNQEEVEKGKLSSLPDFNQDNPEVKKYLIDMAKWWIKETGIDGYRLDTVRHVPKSFWTEFVNEIKKDYPDFYFIGEVFDGNWNYVAGYQKTGMDGLVDFPMHYVIGDVFGNNQPAGRLAEGIEQANAYPNKYLMGTFIDNHDVPRFISQITDFTEERLKQAIAFTMTYTGIPVMYYGTEIALDGGADPDNRRDMDWNAKSAVTDYVKKLASVRKANKALTHGDIKIIKLEDDFICYRRSFEDNTVIVAFNISDKEKTTEMQFDDKIGSKSGLLTSLLEPAETKFKKGKFELSVAPRGVKVFQVKETNMANITIIVVCAAVVIVVAVIVAILIVRARKKTKN
ncbi:MAG: alpha-amylase family glycosyl hydrolase [Clostridia bacterium]|nr:alpha-amylase family glycosyl hydrolase [Clostridia bacterium]